MKKRESKRKYSTFTFDGSFYTITGKIFDVIAVNVYWLLGSVLLVTAGAAFSAMYEAVTKSILGDQGSVSKVFWRAYRRDMKASIPIWLMYAVAVFLLMLNFGIIRENATGLVGLFFQVLYSALVLFVLTAMCYVFPLLSRFEMPWGWHVKLSLYMTVRYLPKSMLILAVFLLSYFLIWKQLAFAFVVPAIGTLVSSYLLEPLLDRHMPENHPEEEEITE